MRAFNAAGEVLGQRVYGIGAMANRQISNVFADLGVTASLPAARLRVHVLRGRLYAYASVIDNRTGDAILVEARR